MLRQGQEAERKTERFRQRYAVFGRKGNAAPGAYCRGGIAWDKAASAVYRYKYVAGHGFVFADYSRRNAVFAKQLFFAAASAFSGFSVCNVI